MVPVRKTVEISEGVRVDLLVTPHMAVYEADAGIEPMSDDAGTAEVLSRYADLMYLAALNAWELDGHGTREDFPHRRGDFHAFLQADGKKFGETVVFMVSALTGKTARELRTAAVPPETPQDEAKAGGQGEGSEVKKKSFLCRIFSRSRRSS